MSKESQSLCFLRVATPTQNQKNYNIHFMRLFEHPYHMGIWHSNYKKNDENSPISRGSIKNVPTWVV